MADERGLLGKKARFFKKKSQYSDNNMGPAGFEPATSAV
jgi:hypothetical protein